MVIIDKMGTANSIHGYYTDDPSIYLSSFGGPDSFNNGRHSVATGQDDLSKLLAAMSVGSSQRRPNSFVDFMEARERSQAQALSMMGAIGAMHNSYGGGGRRHNPITVEQLLGIEPRGQQSQELEVLSALMGGMQNSCSFRPQPNPSLAEKLLGIEPNDGDVLSSLMGGMAVGSAPGPELGQTSIIYCYTCNVCRMKYVGHNCNPHARQLAHFRVGGMNNFIRMHRGL